MTFEPNALFSPFSINYHPRISLTYGCVFLISSSYYLVIDIISSSLLGVVYHNIGLPKSQSSSARHNRYKIHPCNQCNNANNFDQLRSSSAEADVIVWLAVVVMIDPKFRPLFSTKSSLLNWSEIT